MAHRTVEFKWLPRTKSEWAAFTSVRLESARLWAWLVDRHAEARDSGKKWPTRFELSKETNRQFPGLHSQSVQATVGDFCESISSAEALRKKGETFGYPSFKPRYRQVVFANQSVNYHNGRISLPCGTLGRISIAIPKGVVLPGRLMEVRLDYGVIQIVCKIEDQVKSIGSTIGVDLGVNSLIAATDGEKAIVISGREVKATVQKRNKKLAQIQSKQSSKKKQSRRWMKLQRAKHKMLAKNKNKIRDLCHKATRKVSDTFPNAKAIVGKPFNDAAKKVGRQQAQMVSSACNRKIIEMLRYKLAEVTEVEEFYTSQTCPSCGKRKKCGRIYRCRCGFEAPRDIVGCSQIRAIGIDGKMSVGIPVPKTIRFIHPSKYPGVNRVAPRTQGMLLG